MAVTSPIAIKKTLDQALLDANVPFLTGAYATEALINEKNQVCGAVISNRSGRQTVKAKLVIDATQSALIARQAGGKARPFPAGNYTFSRTVMSGENPKGEGLSVREFQNEYDIKVKAVRMPVYKETEIKGKLYECKATIPLKDGTQASLADAEQKMRDLTFTSTQLDASDDSFFMRPDFLQCEGKGTTSEPSNIDLGALRPTGVPYVYVLSQMADIPRDAAAKLTRPCSLMEIGERIGKAAAEEAKKRPALGKVKVIAGNPASASSNTEVREILAGLLPNASNDCGKVKSAARELPVLANCDVLVIGGGTAGAPAAISAARQGMKTIVCEYQANLGGVSTVGVLGSYYFGNVCGFTSEIDEGVKKLGDVLNQCKAEWYRREARNAGAEIWLGTMGTGAVVKGEQLCGVVVVLPDGTRGIVQANAIIDSTGNADIAAAAGEKTEFLNSSELSVQGATMNWRTPGLNVTNVDISFVDDTDAFDMCFFALRARQSFALNLWDQAPLVNSRERRRLIGVKYIGVKDIMNKRTYSDTIVQCKSPHDTHGQTSDDMLFFSIISGSENIITANLPFRALLPQKLDGLLVTGLGISAHRDAIPVLRMQADVQNQGYAAGYAASMSVKEKLPFRKIDIRKLQAHLIEKKILPESVLKQTDDFNVTDKQVAEAVKQIAPYGGYAGIWTILEAPDRAKPLLEEALKNTSEPVAAERLSAVLCMLGNPAGAPALIKALENAPEWDKGWNFQGMGAYGRKTSYQDGYVIALGMLKSKEALPVILKKAAALNAKSEYSHFRAISLSLESIGDKSAAPVLASFLDMPGFSGHSLKFDTKFPGYKGGYGNSTGDRERTLCLREISVARALYRLGDYQGKGEAVLRAYLTDPRSAYARHALMVLGEKQAPQNKPLGKPITHKEKRI